MRIQETDWSTEPPKTRIMLASTHTQKTCLKNKIAWMVFFKQLYSKLITDNNAAQAKLINLLLKKQYIPLDGRVQIQRNTRSEDKLRGFVKGERKKNLKKIF
eukprot:GHVL01001904.1.p1 GENE.GHVL01001904.1~~GHVL01001904.1.p1  ORF type:complete len:102 (-),score=5.13 GHVL01001904.1:495-800(-)